LRWDFGNIRIKFGSFGELFFILFSAHTEFRDVGTYPVYPYPHPETITLPRHLPGLRRATNLGVVFPLSYFNMTMDLVRLGAASTEPVEVDGAEVVPLEFTVAHIISQRPRLLAEAGVDGPAGCLKIVVSGTREAEDGDHTIVFSLSSGSMGAGEGTGIPAGLGALLLLDPSLRTAGVHPPEGIVDPLAMLGLATDILPRLNLGGSDDDGGMAADAAFVHLRGIHTLCMNMCDQYTISDAAFEHLEGIHTLGMKGCSQDTITDAAFARLKGIHSLDIRWCTQATITPATKRAFAYARPR
jgi:hypothetical protein